MTVIQQVYERAFDTSQNSLYVQRHGEKNKNTVQLCDKNMHINHPRIGRNVHALAVASVLSYSPQ